MVEEVTAMRKREEQVHSYAAAVDVGASKGTKTGNPIARPAVGVEVAAQIWELRGQGLGMIKVAKPVRCGVSAVQRVDAIAA
jgi:hypothetical protein